MSTDPAAALDDQALLEAAFDTAIGLLFDGGDPTWQDLVPDRPDLRDALNSAIALAREVVPVPTATPAFDDYTIVRELGAGGMGAVYLARQESLGGRLIALKVLPGWASLSAKGRERFRREAAVVAGLRHPGIVRVHELVQHAQSWAYAMEWIDGPSVAELIREVDAASSDRHRLRSAQKLLPELVLEESATWSRLIASMGAGVANALHAVHRAGLVHRDVKPSNILLRSDGTALLSDFGVACSVDIQDRTRFTQPGGFVGTYAYAPPEQSKADHTPTPQSDIFSLGATLYHALALRPPRTFSETLGQGERKSLHSLGKEVPRDLVTIVDRCLEEDPARRYSSASDLEEDLRRFLDGRVIAARPPTTSRRLALFAGRKRRVRNATLLAGGGGLLLLTFSLLYGLVFPRIAANLKLSTQLALLDDAQEWAIYDHFFFGETRQPFGFPRTADWLADHRKWTERIESMRGTMWRAAVLAPWDADLQRQIRAIDVARSILASADPSRSPIELPQSVCPSLREYARQRIERSALPVVPQVRGVSDSDLRMIGLAAVLSRDVDAAQRAWSLVDLRKRPDPLIDAWLGIALLASEEPARAAPRLHSAALALGSSHYVLTAAAEASARCGDTLQAERWLADVPPLDLQRPLGGFGRVQALVLARSGQMEEARALYTDLNAAFWSLVFNRDHVQFLLDSGDLNSAANEAFMGLNACLDSGYGPDALYLLYDRAINAWWQAKDSQQRLEWLRRAAIVPCDHRTTPFLESPGLCICRALDAIEFLRCERERRPLPISFASDTIYASMDRAGLTDPEIRAALRGLPPEDALGMIAIHCDAQP